MQGRVTNSLTGEPVKKAAVRLMPRRSAGPASVGSGLSSGPQAFAATSEADGTFRFENLDPGDYTLSGQRMGFLNTSYGAKNPLQSGTILTLRPGQQMQNINLALMPQAVISGRVLDSDGDPVDNVRIQALARTWMRGKPRYQPHNGGGTNDLGEYRIANLSPGKYYLYAEKMNYGAPSNDLPAIPGKPDVRPIRTYFPEATNIESATPIEIKAGQDLAGIDIRLHSAPTYHVRGKVAGLSSDNDSDRANVSLSPRSDELGFGPFLGGTNLNKDQSFDIGGIAPGSYNLEVTSMGRGARSVSRQPIDVGSADVNDVVLMVIPPGSLHGQIQLEGTPQAGDDAGNMASIHVNIYPTENGGRFGANSNGPTKADGSFTLENVSPGKYYVNANAPAGTYLKSVRFGSQEILGKELDLSQNPSGELNLVFRYGAAEVDGTVQVPQSSPNSASSSSDGQSTAASTASVVLVPDVLNADGSGIRFGSTNQSGGFSLKQIPPGQYRAYAFEQIDTGQLQNPDVLKQLENLGTEIELKENDKKQVQLSVISAEDVQQIFAKLGIDAQ